MRFLYSLLIQLLRPGAFAIVLWRGLHRPGYWEGLAERFGFGPSLGGPTLMLHAVSLGEVGAAAPLVHALRMRHPELPIVLTTSTPTGRARAQSLFGDAVVVRYLPYDTPGAMRRLIARVRPRALIVMETELWPNLFQVCRLAGIPTLLANARLSAGSVARYSRFGALFRGVLGGGVIVAAQSEEDAARFAAIGADPARTFVAGNVKFDIAVDATAIARGAALRAAQWPARPVWIAGSTHAGEDEAVLAAHLCALAEFPDALLLLVPRHPERFEPVAELLRETPLRFDRRSTGAVRPEAQVVLVDTVGELAALYAAADVAFVGGSLVPVGGHNLLEPAALGVPVLTGPSWINGRDIALRLLAADAALEVADGPALSLAVRGLFEDPERRRQMGESGRRVVEANRGSVMRLAARIDALLDGA